MKLEVRLGFAAPTLDLVFPYNQLEIISDKRFPAKSPSRVVVIDCFY